MFENLTAIPQRFYTPDKKRLSLLAYFFLLMLCFAFFTPGLATMPPTDRDESSFAQASKQMIESGNYTDIRLQDEPRYKKPIGIYWLQSTAERAFNPDHLNQIWAYRLPSLIGAIIAVLMTAALGTVLFTPAAGLLAGMMMAGCVLLNVEARLAKTDAFLLACVVMAQYGLARAYLRHISGLFIPFVFWTAIACGILVKGPIILLPVLSTLLWLRLSDKNIAWFRSLHPVLGVIYALALVAPWFIAISMQSHGTFMQQSAGNDMLAKLWQGQNRGMMPPGMHLLALPIMFFPFALFVTFAAPDMWKSRQDAAVKFCLAWLIPTWIVFELSLTKLPHYVLPAYPALALLTAKVLLDGFPTLTAATRRLPAVLVIGIWFMIGAGFAYLFATLPAFTDDRWLWPQIAAGAVLLLSQGAALLLLPQNKIASFVAMTIGSLVFMTVVFGNTLPSLKHIWLSREIVEAAAAIAPCPHSPIVAVGYHEPSLVFLGGTDTILAANGNDAAKALQKNSCLVAAISNDEKDSFVGAFTTDKPVESGTIEGFNSGHGSKAVMTLYLLPSHAPAP